jgi:hypothetical protein
MKNYRIVGVVVSLAFAICCIAAATFSATTRITLVNDGLVEGSQNHATLAMNAVGRTLIVWNSPVSAIGQVQVRGRWYDENGGALEPEFPLTEPQNVEQATPDVSSDGDSRFVVVWSQGNASGTFDVFCKLFDADGTTLVKEFKVNETTSVRRSFPAVAMNSHGDFVVAWSEYGAQGQDTLVRVYDPSGSPVSDPARANLWNNSNAENNDALPDIAINGDGLAIVVWSFFDSKRAGVSVVYKVFNIASPGVLVSGPESYLQRAARGVSQTRPMADIDATGDMAVAWNEETFRGVNPRVSKVIRFDADRKEWGSSFRPNAGPFANIDRANVILLTTGAFVCCWEAMRSSQDKDRWDIYMRSFNPNGTASTNDVLVNRELTVGDQNRAAVAFARARQHLGITFESDRDAPASNPDMDIYFKSYFVEQ